MPSLRRLWISTSDEQLDKAELALLDSYITPHSSKISLVRQSVSIPKFSHHDVEMQFHLYNKNSKANEVNNNEQKIDEDEKDEKDENNTQEEVTSSIPAKSQYLSVNPVLSSTECTTLALDNDHYQIHTLTFRLIDANNNNNDKDVIPVVLCHGYGCAGGIFIPGMPTLLSQLSKNSPDSNYIIHVIDWLGCGLSSRPRWTPNNVDEAENWFVESLEYWRKSMGYNKLILGGHSLGGYMCGIYNMRYPQYVQHLILISPVGLPIQEPGKLFPGQGNIKIENKDISDSKTIDAAVTDHKDTDEDTDGKEGDYKETGDDDSRKESVDKDNNTSTIINQLPWKQRMMLKTFRSLWSKGWTPQDIIRLTGPWGNKLVHNMIQRRLFRIDDNDKLKPLLSEYIYHVVTSPGSGEYALSKILLPGAWAISPLLYRLPVLYEYINDHKLRLDFIYGEIDWMGNKCAYILKKHYYNNHENVNITILKDSGHQLILENVEGCALLLADTISLNKKI